MSEPDETSELHGRGRGFWSAALFAVLALVYLATEPPRVGLPPTDFSPNSLVPVALLRHGDCDLTPYDALLRPRVEGSLVIRIRGRLISFYPIGASVSAVPFYVPYFLFSRVPVALSDAEHAGRLAAGFYAAASAVLLVWILWGLTSPGRAVLLGVLYGLGTCNLSILNKALWQHAPAEFWITAGIYALSGARLHRSRWLAAAGLCLGMSVFCRPSNLPFLLAPLAWMLLERRLRECVLIALGAAVPAAMNIAYNVVYTGEIVSSLGYGTLSLAWHPDRLWGMLASPGRGLFVFIPFLLLLPVALLHLRRLDVGPRRLVTAMLAGFAGSLFMTSLWHVWWGGWSYGPRLLADGTPVLVLALATLPAGRLWTGLLSSLGAVAMAIHGLGAISVGRPLHWDAIYMPGDDRSPDVLWSFRRSPIPFYAASWVRQVRDLRPSGLTEPGYCLGTMEAEYRRYVRPGRFTLAWVSLRNDGRDTWWQVAGKEGRGAMQVEYEWRLGERRGPPGFSGRSLLWDDVDPGETLRTPVSLMAPLQPGTWTLHLTPVATRARRCDDGPNPLFVDLRVTVR